MPTDKSKELKGSFDQSVRDRLQESFSRLEKKGHLSPISLANLLMASSDVKIPFAKLARDDTPIRPSKRRG